MRPLLLLLALTLSVLITTLSTVSSVCAVESAPIRVLCTTTILRDITQQVGGTRVATVSLIKAGTDPHTFQPTPDDVSKIAAAQLVIVNGLGYEGWLEELIAAAGISRDRIIVASTGIESMTAGAHKHEGHGHKSDQDPHAWHDAKNGMRYAANIRDALTAIDAEGAGDYAAWTELYQAHLRVVDAWIKKQIATLPPERRVLVTSHDAMAYFAKAYGLQVIPVEGITTGQEPDPQTFSALIAELRQRRIPAVFIESTASPRVVELLGQEAGARLGGTLLADSLQPPGKLGDSYIGMFMHNTRTIISGLQ